MLYGNFLPAIPTSKFESNALRYLKYSLMDDYGQMVGVVEDSPLFHSLDSMGKVLRNTDGSIAQVFTPSNADIIAIAYSFKGRYRKIAMLRKKAGCSLPPVGFKSWDDYDYHHGYIELED